jgi:hypothetical protein
VSAEAWAALGAVLALSFLCYLQGRLDERVATAPCTCETTDFDPGGTLPARRAP